jgi:hypothetical protein
MSSVTERAAKVATGILGLRLGTVILESRRMVMARAKGE